MTAHYHTCDVPGCKESFSCGAPMESHDTSTGLCWHCTLEESNTAYLCDEHQGWEMCDWCGQWYDAQHSYLTHPPACSQACADQLQPPTDSAKEGAA